METMTHSRADARRTSPIPRPFQIDFPGFEIEPTDTVVDVGCGPGNVCVYAGHRGADVIGIDNEPIEIERAAVAMRGVPARSFRGIVSDANPIPLPDACASAVVATEVMEHVDDPPRFLAELVRIGKPGARYLISVPDTSSEAIMREVAPSWYWEKPLHIHVFERTEFARLVRAAGLDIVAYHAVGFYWSMWWALRMAIGMEHKYAEPPDDPLLSRWNALAATLREAPHGPEVLGALDRALPKSQVIIATKGGRPSYVTRWKRRLRDGGFRFGGFEFRWSLRRTLGSL